MGVVELTPVGQQIYWSAPARVSIGGCAASRCARAGARLPSGCCARGGCADGRHGLAAAQAQAARLLAVGATGAGWPTRRGDALRPGGDRLAAALARRAGLGGSPAAQLLAAHDLLDEITEWLLAGALGGPAAPSARSTACA